MELQLHDTIYPLARALPQLNSLPSKTSEAHQETLLTSKCSAHLTASFLSIIHDGHRLNTVSALRHDKLHGKSSVEAANHATDDRSNRKHSPDLGINLS
jgi:hypothetical protein